MTIASDKQLYLENGQTHAVSVVETNGEWLCSLRAQSRRGDGVALEMFH